MTNKQSLRSLMTERGWSCVTVGKILTNGGFKASHQTVRIWASPSSPRIIGDAQLNYLKNYK